MFYLEYSYHKKADYTPNRETTYSRYQRRLADYVEHDVHDAKNQEAKQTRSPGKGCGGNHEAQPTDDNDYCCRQIRLNYMLKKMPIRKTLKCQHENIYDVFYFYSKYMCSYICYNIKYLCITTLHMKAGEPSRLQLPIFSISIAYCRSRWYSFSYITEPLTTKFVPHLLAISIT